MVRPTGGLEIERKYLIAFPDEAVLMAEDGCVKVTMKQVYLRRDESGASRRVRCWEENGVVDYHYTEKRRISAVTREETEREITREEFERLQQEAEPSCRPIEKTRYRIPYRGQLVEIDIFPFWKKQAILEVELESEGQEVFLPPYVKLLREVTEEACYTNHAIAKNVPAEEDCV